jgi:hypothetical protein
MPEDEDKRQNSGRWDKITKIISQSGARGSTPPKRQSLEVLHHQHRLEVPHSSVQKPDAAIARFKANQIERKAALQNVAVWYQGQIEAAEHAVKEAVRVRKAEATKVAERLLMEINEEHFRYLMSLGLRNEATRQKAMLELGDQTSLALKEIEGRDWPPQLMEQAMHALMERQTRFFQKLMEDLGEE